MNKLLIILSFIPCLLFGQVRNDNAVGSGGIKIGASVGVGGIGVSNRAGGVESVDTMTFTSVQPVTIDQVSIVFQTLANTDTIYLNWGDGSAVEKISGTTDQTKTSNYSTNNTTYTIKLYGNLSKTKKLSIFEPTVASLDINDISDYMTALQYLHLRDVTSSGNKALPSTLTYLYLRGFVSWVYSGALPDGLTNLFLSGNDVMHWTGLDIGDFGNITYFDLSNYRIAKMSSTDMVILLTQMTNRTGSLPSTVQIRDYEDYLSPPQAVTDAATLLKSTKSITTLTLGQ